MEAATKPGAVRTDRLPRAVQSLARDVFAA